MHVLLRRMKMDEVEVSAKWNFFTFQGWEWAVAGNHW
jgi:hypothetical protein